MTAGITVFVAILSDVAIALTKFIAAAVSGSSAMSAEGIHSIVDAANGLLILWGIHQSAKPADDAHPFGHGKELYFWALIVGLLIFSLGGGVTAYEGILHMRRPVPLTHLLMNYIVLAVSAVLEGVALWIAVLEFRRGEGRRGLWRGIRISKDPTTFTVILTNAAALAGLSIAFLGLYLGNSFDRPYLDGLASVLIGILLAAVAVVLLAEIKGLLIGEGARPSMLGEIRNLVQSDSSVERVGHPLTMYFGPATVLLALEVQFRDGLCSEDVALAVDRLESRVRSRYPEIKKIFIEAESFRGAHSNESATPGR